MTRESVAEHLAVEQSLPSLITEVCDDRILISHMRCERPPNWVTTVHKGAIYQFFISGNTQLVQMKKKVGNYF